MEALDIHSNRSYTILDPSRSQSREERKRWRRRKSAAAENIKFVIYDRPSSTFVTFELREGNVHRLYGTLSLNNLLSFFLEEISFYSLSVHAT